MYKHKKKHKAPLRRPLEQPHLNLKELMDEVALRKASFSYKHELLLHHQKIHYQSEYDRIREMLEHTNLPESSIKQLDAIQNHLYELITDDLYPTTNIQNM